MTELVEKAFAYITRDDELLVFRHVDSPEAGIQVPAGTIEPGELYWISLHDPDPGLSPGHDAFLVSLRSATE